MSFLTKLSTLHGGKYRIYFLLFHLSLTSLILFFSPPLRSLSPFSLCFWYCPNRFFSFFSILFYLLSAYSSPGYILLAHELKRSFPTSAPPTPVFLHLEPLDRIDAVASCNSECAEESFKQLQDAEKRPRKTHEDRSSMLSEENLSLETARRPVSLSLRVAEKSETQGIVSSYGKILAVPKRFMLEGGRKKRNSLPSFFELEKEKDENKKENESACSLPRFCLVCNVDQPLRARHCNACIRCVHKYDHHCTWLGNCIGEKNYLFYYFYLIFQSSELLMVLYDLFTSLFSASSLIFSVIMLVLLFPLSLFSFFLLFLHTYLISKNLTTWELIAWKKLSYLSHRSQSPFNLGLFSNLRLALPSAQPRDWSLYLPSTS
jgi:hypothetical protein